MLTGVSGALIKGTKKGEFIVINVGKIVLLIYKKFKKFPFLIMLSFYCVLNQCHGDTG